VGKSLDPTPYLWLIRQTKAALFPGKTDAVARFDKANLEYQLDALHAGSMPPLEAQFQL
jgi:hypothetical protein